MSAETPGDPHRYAYILFSYRLAEIPSVEWPSATDAGRLSDQGTDSPLRETSQRIDQKADLRAPGASLWPCRQCSDNA